MIRHLVTLILLFLAMAAMIIQFGDGRLDGLFWLLIAGMTAYGFRRSQSIISSMAWMKANQQLPNDDIDESNHRIVIIIPVYKAQAAIGKTLQYFADLMKAHPGMELIMVTSEKEAALGDKVSTMEVVKQQIAIHRHQRGGHGFSWCHCPDPEAEMKEQVNFAVEQCLVDCSPLQVKRTFIAVYSVSSRPNPTTFDHLRVLIDDGDLEVAVQNSVHLANFDQLPGGFSGCLLKAAAIFQSRWSMEEIAMQRQQSLFWFCHHRPLGLWATLREKMAYCIGHGSFFRADIWQRIGGFPQECELDDLPLGFLLTIEGISIRPLPVLENCDAPDSMTALVAQKATWYRMMLGYMAPRKIALERKMESALRINIVTIRSFIRDAASWALMTPVTVFLLLYPALQQSWLFFAAAVFAFGCFSWFGVWLMLRQYPELIRLSFGNAVPLGLFQRLTICAFTLIYCLLVSLGPFQTILNKLAGRSAQSQTAVSQSH